MTAPSLETIEAKVDALVKRCAELEKETAAMREKEALWLHERGRLIEKNEKARSRVETMIAHLKNINAESEQQAS